MDIHGVHLADKALTAFCRQHGVAKLSLFGSIIREDFGPESDVDILIDFVPGKRIGLLGMSSLELELTALVGRKVDLRTPQDISRHFRARVIEEARVQYAA